MRKSDLRMACGSELDVWVAFVPVYERCKPELRDFLATGLYFNRGTTTHIAGRPVHSSICSWVLSRHERLKPWLAKGAWRRSLRSTLRYAGTRTNVDPITMAAVIQEDRPY